MFGLYFGNYLVEKSKISQAQFDEIIAKQQKTRVKLGLIAVSEKLLTTKQADEINDIQRKLDRRFGDIAIEKGYLLSEEVTHLLNLQGNPYLQFVQVVSDSEILSIQEIEDNLEEYKKENHFTDSDIEALKSGDIDRIIPIFIGTDSSLCTDLTSLFLRNIVRFISTDVIIKKPYEVSGYSFGSIAFQKMTGKHEFFVGFSCKKNELLQIANPFAKESFTEMDEDSFDSVCEFINCTNGLFASKLSEEDIHIDMLPPLYDKNKNLETKDYFQILPIIIGGKQTELIIIVDSPEEIK